MSAIPGVTIVKYGDASTHMDLSETSQLAKAKHDAAMRRIEVEKLARTMPVPVDNTAVCLRLRLLGEPITIFGETTPDRRERLRRHFAEMHIDGTLEAFNKQFERPKESQSSKLPSGDQPSFRAEGPPDLAVHRFRIAHDSLQRAQSRLSRERERKAALALDSNPPHPLTGMSDLRTLPASAVTARKEYARAQLRSRAVLGGLTLVASQVADTRAVSAIAFAPVTVPSAGAAATAGPGADLSGGVVGTASWTGSIHLWASTSASILATYRGHCDRVSDIAFHPLSNGFGVTTGAGLGPRQAQMISAGVDAVFLWPSASAGAPAAGAGEGEGKSAAVKAEPPAEGYLGAASSAMDDGNDDEDNEYGDDAYDANGELKHFSARALAGSGRGVHGAYATAMGTSSGGLTSHPSRTAAAAAALGKGEGAGVMEVKPLARLDGHTARACRAVWLPHGGYAVTTSMDSSWRLWDVCEGREVMAQQGHSMGTYGVAAHPDGSLICVGDLSGNARVWDLRSGLALAAFEAHAGAITACDFACDGFSVATASGDGTVKVWDLRARRVASTIPAHSSLVSDVKFRPGDSTYLLTSGYDGSAAVWSRVGRDRVALLRGAAQRVMRAAWSPDGDRVATAGFDCTWKMWQYEGEEPVFEEEDLAEEEARADAAVLAAMQDAED